MSDFKIPKNSKGYTAVGKIAKSLETKAGNLPGSRRVVAGPRLIHKDHLVLPGNLPKSRRYVGSVVSDDGWRDDLIEAILSRVQGS